MTEPYYPNSVLPKMRLLGTKSEIYQILYFLKTSKCIWTSSDKYYPQKDNPNLFAYYLDDLKCPLLWFPPMLVNPNEPQPQPYDAVLGGKQSGQS